MDYLSVPQIKHSMTDVAGFVVVDDIAPLHTGASGEVYLLCYILKVT